MRQKIKWQNWCQDAWIKRSSRVYSGTGNEWSATASRPATVSAAMYRPHREPHTRRLIQFKSLNMICRFLFILLDFMPLSFLAARQLNCQAKHAASPSSSTLTSSSSPASWSGRQVDFLSCLLSALSKKDARKDIAESTRKGSFIWFSQAPFLPPPSCPTAAAPTPHDSICILWFNLKAHQAKFSSTRSRVRTLLYPTSAVLGPLSPPVCVCVCG